MTQTELQNEIEKILYLLQLKKVTRWGFMREANNPTESVAEHVYGLMVLAKYFLPILEAEQELNHQQIFDMILWHDTGEIETGDIPTFQKTQAHTDAEIIALEQVRQKTPTHLATKVYDAAITYESTDSPEVQFMKMLDKMEGAFSLVANLDVARQRFAKQQVTKEMFLSKRAFVKENHGQAYPYVLEIVDMLESNKCFCNQ